MAGLCCAGYGWARSSLTRSWWSHDSAGSYREDGQEENVGRLVQHIEHFVGQATIRDGGAEAVVQVVPDQLGFEDECDAD